MIANILRPGTAVLAMTFALTLGASPAAAQWNATAIGVAEYDTNETRMLLAGVSMSPAGTQLRPTVGVQVMHLAYPVGNTDVTVWSVRPSVGVTSGFAGGAWNARVGYAFTNREEDSPAAVVVTDAGAADGVVLSGGVDWWGAGGGPLAAQLLGAYNLGSDALWTRARVTTRLAQMAGGGQVHVGAETAFLSQPGYSAIQPGGVVQWHTGHGPIFGLGAGVKIIDEGDTPVYVKGEVVLPLVRN